LINRKKRPLDQPIEESAKMKKIKLPIIGGSTDLDTAVDVLKQRKRGAVLWEKNGLYRLSYVGSIVAGRAKYLVSLSDLSPEHVLSVGNRIPQLVLEQVNGDWASLEVYSDAVADRYVASPSDYYCDGPPYHDIFSAAVRLGDPCPYRDGNKIVSI
jgi:hypothetical protein